jgi:hypothetical protein
MKESLRPTQPPIQWVSGALTLVVKRFWSEEDPPPPSNEEVKNAWSCTSTPNYVFMVKVKLKLYHAMKAYWGVEV